MNKPGPDNVPRRARARARLQHQPTTTSDERPSLSYRAGCHTRRWIDHVISLAISAVRRDRKRRMVTSSSGSTNARSPLPATAL
jgi:hypothetical protein